MRARRFLSGFIVLAVLLGQILSMGGGPAFGEGFEMIPTQYSIHYFGVNEVGESVELIAVEGFDFAIEHIDGPNGTQLWFDMYIDIPLDAVRVTVLYSVGPDTVEYRLFDPIAYTDILNLSQYMMMGSLGAYTVVDDQYMQVPDAVGVQLGAGMGMPIALIEAQAAQGTDDWNTGADDWNTGTDDWNTGTDDWNTGADDWNTGTDDWNTGTDDWNTGTDDWNTGTDDWNTGTDDWNTGTDDWNTDGDGLNAGGENTNGGYEDPYSDSLGTDAWQDNALQSDPEPQTDIGTQSATIGMQGTGATLYTETDAFDPEVVLANRETDLAEISLPQGAVFYTTDMTPSDVLLPLGTKLILAEDAPQGQPLITSDMSRVLVRDVFNTMIGYVDVSSVRFLSVVEHDDYMATVQKNPLPAHETNQLIIDNTIGAGLYKPGSSTIMYPLSEFDIVTFVEGAILPHYTDEYGQQWVFVQTADGQTGYVSLGFARFMTEQDIADSQMETEVYPESFPSEYANVSASGATLYLMPSNTAVQLTSQDVLKHVQSPNYDTSRRDPSNAKRIQLLVENITTGELGYVGLSEMTFMSQADAAAYGDEPMPSRQSDLATVNAGGAYLRDSENGSSIKQLPAQTVVRYLSDSLVNHKRWVRVQGDLGVKGYLLSSEITFMTEAQEASYEILMTVQNSGSNYADINKDNTYIYGVEGELLATKKKDEVVKYVPGDINEKYLRVSAGGVSEVMIRVEISEGKTGYIRRDDVTFKTAQGEKEYLQLLAGPQATLKPGTSRYARVTDNRVNVRQAPDGTLLSTQLNKDEVVLVTEQVTASDGKLWSKIVLPNGKDVGYVQADLLALMSDEDDAAWAASHPIAQETEEKTTTPPLQKVLGYMRVKQLAPFYDWMNIGAVLRAAIPAGTVLYVTDQAYDGSNILWNATRYGDYPGYIQASYMETMTEAEVKTYYQQLFGEVPTAPPTQPPVATSQFSGYGLVLESSVNFRTGASTSSAVVAKLSKNTIVRILDDTTAGGYTWYQCESGGKIGYLRGDYLAPLTIGQYQAVVSSPSYSSGGNVITPTATANPSGVSSTTWATANPGASSGISFQTLAPLATATPNPSDSPDPDESASPDPLATDGDAEGQITEAPTSTVFPPVDDPTFPVEETGGFSPPSLLLVLLAIILLGGGGGYGYYVYNRERAKKAKEESLKNADAARSRAQAAMQGTGAQPALRRPVPPGQPQPSANGAPPRVAGVAGQPGPRSAQPGQAGQQGQGGQAIRPNPYARPGQPGQPVRPSQPGQTGQGQPAKAQDAPPPASRARVDGKPLPPVQPNPYARPQDAAQEKKAPGGGTVPVAPPPPEFSEATPAEAEPRRRRRRSEEQGITEDS